MEDDKFRIEPKYKTVTKTFRIPIEMNGELEKLACKNNVSMNGLIIQCLQFSLSHLDCREKPKE